MRREGLRDLSDVSVRIRQLVEQLKVVSMSMVGQELLNDVCALCDTLTHDLRDAQTIQDHIMHIDVLDDAELFDLFHRIADYISSQCREDELQDDDREVLLHICEATIDTLSKRHVGEHSIEFENQRRLAYYALRLMRVQNLILDNFPSGNLSEEAIAKIGRTGSFNVDELGEVNRIAGGEDGDQEE